MREDGSVVVSELAVVVLVLARSVTNAAHDGFLVAHLYSTESARSPVRLPTTTHVPNCYENESRATERGNEERVVRDTHHASRWQCCRIGSCSSCFRTCSLARSSMLHISASRSHTYIPHNQHTHCTPFEYHSCSELLRKRLARLQKVAVDSPQ